MTHHALPNAAIPTVTIIGFMVGSLVAGAVVVESVFAWPGVGRLLVSAVANRDLAVVQAILMVIAAWMVVAEPHRRPRLWLARSARARHGRGALTGQRHGHRRKKHPPFPPWAGSSPYPSESSWLPPGWS